MAIRKWMMYLSIVTGLILLAFAWSNPTATCVAGTGVERHCESSTRAMVVTGAAAVFGIGFLLTGSYSVYRGRRIEA